MARCRGEGGNLRARGSRLGRAGSPGAPPAGLLATIFIQSETELAPGDVVELGVVPIVDTGGGAVITGFGADELTGQITIIAVEDDRICFDIDTTDSQQRLDGTVSAEFAG